MVKNVKKCQNHCTLLHAAFICALSPVLYRLVVPARQAKIHAAIQNSADLKNLGGRVYFENFRRSLGANAQLLDLQSKNRKGESCSAWSLLSNEPPWDLVGVAIEKLY
jgi:hypothetical protein